MSIVLKGKIALLTGTATGIGFAVAKEFAQQGANVILLGNQQK